MKDTISYCLLLHDVIILLIEGCTNLINSSLSSLNDINLKPQYSFLPFRSYLNLISLQFFNLCLRKGGGYRWPKKWPLKTLGTQVVDDSNKEAKSELILFILSTVYLCHKSQLKSQKLPSKEE